ncbi:MAG: C4-dicarboxylate ABC transporter permease [Rhodobacterales bacterium]|nr:MAG: C4-dicarboxylate ABC transporter permease [Rhodobacterales bacterium]
MKRLLGWAARGAELFAGGLLAALFITFLVQVFSRHAMQTPFGWTLELCLILWLWIVFFGNAFVLRPRDHVRFDLVCGAAPRGVRRVMALVSAAAIVVAMLWAFWPTWDYIDWMKIRGTATLRTPFTGEKIPMRLVFSVYALFMIALALRALWRIVSLLSRRPPGGEGVEEGPS